MVKRVSIVTPVYNEQDNVKTFFDSVSGYLKDISIDWEIVYCVDPCSDGTLERIRQLSQSSDRVKMLLFSRRVGQDLAISAGINASRSDAIVIMDCDLQDPPSVLPQMIQEWLGGAPMVIGRRRTRESDSPIKRYFSRKFYLFLNKFSDASFHSDAGDFRLIDRSIAIEFSKYTEQKPFVRGIFAHIAPRSVFVEFDRPKRNSGVTKYHAQLGGYKVALNGVIGFSDVLLRLSFLVGLIVSFTSLIFGLVYVFLSLYIPNLPTGLPTIVVLLCILGGTILMAIGVQGLYISKILAETQNRPKYFVVETIGF